MPAVFRQPAFVSFMNEFEFVIKVPNNCNDNDKISEYIFCLARPPLSAMASILHFGTFSQCKGSEMCIFCTDFENLLEIDLV